MLSMMTGEIDYGGTFYGDDEEQIAFKNVLKVLFIVFVITVVILLQNLLIGLTVSDVQVCMFQRMSIVYCHTQL